VGYRHPRSGNGASNPDGRGRPGSDAFGPRLAARTCEESMTARDQSNFPAPCNSASNNSCSCCQTPARFHSSRRRQQVMPDPNPNSRGRNSHWIPVCSTNKIPHNTCRSGILFRPGYRGFRTGWGSNGSMRFHSPSGTTHGGCSPRLTAPHCRSISTTDGRPQDHFVRNSKLDSVGDLGFTVWRVISSMIGLVHRPM
jgi:hypothetical protein